MHALSRRQPDADAPESRPGVYVLETFKAKLDDALDGMKGVHNCARAGQSLVQEDAARGPAGDEMDHESAGPLRSHGDQLLGT